MTERGYLTRDVASRLGVSFPTLYKWINMYPRPEPESIELQVQAAEIRRLLAELKRVSEKRDNLKKPPRTLLRSSGKVPVHQGSCEGCPPCVASNQLQQNFDVENLNQVWVTDTTHISGLPVKQSRLEILRRCAQPRDLHES